MTTRDFAKMLQKITENDIEDMGEDIDGHRIFAVHINGKVSSLVFDDMDIKSFPQWSGDPNNILT